MHYVNITSVLNKVFLFNFCVYSFMDTQSLMNVRIELKVYLLKDLFDSIVINLNLLAFGILLLSEVTNLINLSRCGFRIV